LNTLTFDFECNTFAKGNPYSKQGKAVCLGLKDNYDKTECEFDIHYLDESYFTHFDLCIAFNVKFDIAWARRLGFQLPKQIWCCQLAEYMLNNQQAYPSLEETAKKYGLPSKLDIVKTEYWENGVDTDAIPQEVLAEYCIRDVNLTYDIYLSQKQQFEQRPSLYRLFKLACQDLLVLHEMEWNGLIYNEQLCKERVEECNKRREEILSILGNVYPHLSINFASNDQLSAFLYGGKITETVKQPIGFFKTGERKGQVKFQNVEVEHTLPRMVNPLPKSEMKKEGVFATDEGTLKKLKGPFAKKYVSLILELAKLDKLIGTYYGGLPKLNKEMDWEEHMLHGQLNQCVTQTGRLSASSPNQQNIAGDVADIIISCYED